MSTLIPAVQYKNMTGLSTKLQGIYYAKKFNIKTNRKIKNAKHRYIDFLTKLKIAIDNYDNKIIWNKIINKNVNDFILTSEVDPRATLDISLGDLLNKKIRTKINNKIYIREANGEITNDFLLEVFRNINNKNGKYIMAEIYYDYFGGGEDIPRHGKKYYVVNTLFLESLKKKGDEEEFYEGLDINSVITRIKVYYINKTKGKRKLEGGLFKYQLKESKTDPYLVNILKKYQIYDSNYIENNTKDINCEKNCLIHALLLSGVDKKFVDKLKLKCKSFVIPLKEVENFALENNLIIFISGDKHNYKYGNKGKQIHLCLLEDHYFINEEVNITRYSIKNYDDVKNEKKWWEITGIKKIGDKNYYRRETKGNNNSFRLIKDLLEYNLLEPIKLNNNTISLINYNKINLNDMDLDNSKDEYEEITPRENKNDVSEYIENNLKGKEWATLRKLFKDKNFVKQNIKIAFDFETTTDQDFHKNYLVSCCLYEGTKQLTKPVSFIGEDCSINFLEYIFAACCKYLIKFGIDFKNRKKNNKNQIISEVVNRLFDFTLFAHNITYDIQFLMKNVYCYNPIIRSSNKVCGGSFIFKGIKFKLKDTYAILDCKLSSFKDFFNLNIKKEIMPYELYNEKNVNKGVCKISDALKYIKNKEDQDEFIKNIIDLKLKIGDDNFNHIGYAKFYCERDIKIMMEGYFIFRQWVLNQLSIDIDDFLTISSISDQYFKLQGCYNGCYYINGIARYYIQNTVVGGRCMSRQNLKYCLEQKLNDFDGVSLYPSAMKRLGLIGGYLKGKPKLIEKDDLNMEFLNSIDGYFIRIRLNKVRIERDFPLISYVNKEGIRIFTNELDDENNIIFVNKFSLEDMMVFHGIKEKDFDILDGYYFDEGRNNKICEVIEKIFNLRLKFKAEGNPIQGLYKLLMNSSYGKTITKEQNTKITYIDNKEQKNKYISMNYNHITEIEKLYNCEKYLIKERKSINGHTNACHIGSEILAMSKRIMNEVMCLAEDKEIKIYYQDTDSMHIEDEKIQYLSKIYKKKYNRDLIGKNLGQFHCDFEPIFVNGKEVKAKHAIKTIILGKKAYLDIVKYENGDLSTHYRMKGIPQQIVKLKADEDFNGSLYNLYRVLYDGQRIDFDLLANGKPIFKFGHGSVSNSKKFTRSIYFKNEELEMEDDESEEDYEEIFDKIGEFVEV